MITEQNTLFPIFLKTEQLQIVVVGGGYVAEEKLHFLLKSSPKAQVKIVAPIIRAKTLQLAKQANAKVVQKSYDVHEIKDAHIVIATTDNEEVNKQIYLDCRMLKILVNVADNPPLCDFYMGGIVTKGNVKLAISTNGKSPTMAKRLREFFEDVLPSEIDQLSVNLNIYRKRLKGDFEQKVKQLNQLTEKFIKS